MSLLITLYERNPTYPGLASAVETISGEKIQQYLREGNYAAARRVLDLWQKQFQDIATQTAMAWQQRFEVAASRQLADATQRLAKRDFIGAKIRRRALTIWPNLPAAQQVRDRIEREYRFVTVGVFETSPRNPTRRIDDWASLRTSALVQHPLAEQVDFGAEGGVYTSHYGQWSLDDTGRQLSLKSRCQLERELGRRPRTLRIIPRFTGQPGLS